MREAGKGDKQRPTNHDSFADNFEKIFGKKHYQPGSLEQQVFDDQIAPYLKELDEAMIGKQNEPK